MAATPSASADTDAAGFTALVQDVRGCVRCDRVAHSHVLGDTNGRLDACVMFVAEAVGRRGGAITGIPLTQDESGKRFTAFLEVAGIRREHTFTTNAVLCNPLDGAGRNRTPLPREVANCRPFLARTLAQVRAPVVVALGRVALESLRTVEAHNADLRRDAGTAVPWQDRLLVPMYHPGRQSTLSRPHDEQVEDWRRLGAILARAASRPGAPSQLLE